MRKLSLMFLLVIVLSWKPAPRAVSMGAAAPLAERLGFKSSEKILIINVDDVGNSHAANAAVIDAMENGLATSSTIIVPGPWFPEIAAYAKSHPNSDFGVHLAHTSEWKTLPDLITPRASRCAENSLKASRTRSSISGVTQFSPD